MAMVLGFNRPVRIGSTFSSEILMLIDGKVYLI
jgi:hypothetical protein